MTIIAPCRYNSFNQLLVPRRLDVENSTENAQTESFFEHTNHATFDRGYYHRYVIEVFGRTPAEACQRLDAKLERFIQMGSTKGAYRPIRRSRWSGTVGIDHKVKMAYTLIYAIE